MKKKRFLIWAFVFSLILSFSNFSGALAQKNAEEKPDWRTGEILLRLKNNPQIYKIKTDKSQIDSLIAEYKQLPMVDLVEANQLYKGQMIPDDTFYSKQYYHNQIFSPDAWDRTTGSKSIIIAVIDSGVDVRHPDLVPNIWQNPREIPGNGVDDDHNGFTDDNNGWDFVLNQPDPSPKSAQPPVVQTINFQPAPVNASSTPPIQTQSDGLGAVGYNAAAGLIGLNHGTVVAGVAAARGNNKEGVAGVCWMCRIMPIRILDNSGFGDTLNVVRGIDYAIQNGASVINLSFVGFDQSDLMDEAIKRAYKSNVVVVAASGNDVINGGTNLDVSPGYPVCTALDNGRPVILGVAALDQDDKKAKFSNYGANCISLSAPGVNFFSTQTQVNSLGLFDLYGDGWSGTSMAAPLISGAAGLIKSLRPVLSNRDIIDILMNSSDSVDKFNPEYAGKLGSGRLNLFKAVLAAMAKTPTPAGSDSSSNKPGIGPSSPVGLNLPSSSLDNKSLVVVPASNLNSQVHIYDLSSLSIAKSFTAFNKKFTGGLNLVTGDIDSDGHDEIIVAPGQGGAPQVKVFTPTGALKAQFMAAPTTFLGGLSLALIDVDDVGNKGIVVGYGNGGQPKVRVFTPKGKLVLEFNAFPNNFKGGVNVAAFSASGTPQIIATTGPGTIAKARIFDLTGKQIYEYVPFVNFRGGLSVTVADLRGDGNQNVVFAPASDGGPQIKIFNLQGVLIGHFAAFAPNLNGGVTISTGDVSPENGAEIVVGSGKKSEARVRVFDLTGQKKIDFLPYPLSYKGGVRAVILNSKAK